MDEARGPDETRFMAFIGKDLKHSATLKQTPHNTFGGPVLTLEDLRRAEESVNQKCYSPEAIKAAKERHFGTIEEIVRQCIEQGYDAGRMARTMFPAVRSFGSAFWNPGGKRVLEISGRAGRGEGIEFKQLVMAEFPNAETSAVDYEAHVRERELRRMQGVEVHIGGILVGRVDEIRIEQRAGEFSFNRLARPHVIGELKFLGDMEGINALVEAQFNNRRGGGMIPAVPARRKSMANEAKPYERKNIVAIVYRQYNDKELAAIADGMSFSGPRTLPAATRDTDAQLRLIGYVYEGETPEQIINDDIEKRNPVGVNEDRTYLVFDSPGVVEVEGPKSRTTVRRKSGNVMGTTDSPR